MHYSNIRSRAGLVALVFALIISLVSAVPIPATESGLSSTLSPSSNPSLDGFGQDHHIQLDTTKISLSGRMSTLPAATRALTRRQHISTDMDDQLVRRNFFSDIGHAFQKVGGAIKRGVQKVGGVIKKAGNAVKNGFQKVGNAVKNVAQKVGRGIKTVVKKVGHAVKAVGTIVKKVGHAIKTAVKKVGHFIKTTGAQVAKFGLKVVQSVGAAAGKVANFIPGIGIPVGEALNGVSNLAGIASNDIHVNLPGNLQNGMNILNKADQIMNYIP